ncbi:MAG: ATP-binding protein [Dehalococcoidia bacterium]
MSAKIHSQRHVARRKLLWRMQVTSLRVRIFLAMVAGALMVTIAAGIAVMNRISDDFDQRVAMQSYSAGRLALQFYTQRETQLAHTARVVAGMPGLRAALAAPSTVSWHQLSVNVRAAAQLGTVDDLLIYNQSGKLLFADDRAAGGVPPLSLAAILAQSSMAGEGAETFHGQPTLVGGASILSADVNGNQVGAVAVTEPIGGQLLAPMQEQIGYPCSVFDSSGHFVAASQGREAWPTAFPTQAERAPANAGAADNPPAGQRVPMEKGADVFLLPLFNPHGDLAASIALYQPTTAVRQQQGSVQSLFLALILAGLFVSATVAWLFSRMLVRPIQQLSLAAEEIAGGRYDHAIPVRGADEIGRLTETFEHMRRRIGETTRALVEEKRRSEAEATVVNAVLNATNDGIIMLDAAGRFRVANHRWESMFGIDSATLTDLSAEALRDRLRRGMADPDAFDRASDALLLDPERTVYQEEFLQCWPETRPLRRYSAPVREQSGEIIGRVYVYIDISRERETDELKQALLSTVSHELRTPLTTIKGYARTLLIEDWDRETRNEFLRIIDEEADHLSELVDNLLDLSKLEAGVLQIHREPVLLGPLLQRVVQRRRETSRQHQYQIDCAEDLPLVLGDPRRLEQVVENLLENARKYSEGGSISIAAHQADDHVEVTVSDQGQGIPSELVERVFERFYRIDNSLSRGTGGTGLGLSICRGLVEAHGGHIRITQTSPQGTSIAFTLPVMAGGASLIDDEPIISATALAQA